MGAGSCLKGRPSALLAGLSVLVARKQLAAVLSESRAKQRRGACTAKRATAGKCKPLRACVRVQGDARLCCASPLLRSFARRRPTGGGELLVVRSHRGASTRVRLLAHNASKSLVRTDACIFELLWHRKRVPNRHSREVTLTNSRDSRTRKPGQAKGSQVSMQTEGILLHAQKEGQCRGTSVTSARGAFNVRESERSGRRRVDTSGEGDKEG